jgi:hypothetical protein
MNNAPTPSDRGQERPHEAEPLFPSEGPFNTVVPLSELGQAPAPLPRVDPADVGKPAEAEWAREAHRARLKEEEETLVPARARRAKRVRRSWVTTAAVIALSVAAGLASGTYLIWSSQRAPEPAARVANETQSPPPAPAAQGSEAAAEGERVKETAEVEKPGEAAKAEQSKPEKSNEVAHAPKQPSPLQPAPRAERATRAAEAEKVTAAPKPARVQSAPPRPRPTTAQKQPPTATPSARSLPISSPPPTANSKKVIQWP